MVDEGFIITVDGKLKPDQLGIVLPHEHLFCDFAESYFELPSSSYERKIANEEVSLDNLWYIKRNGLNHKGNLRLDSPEEIVTEVDKFHQVGGGTIVEVTPKATGQDVRQVKAVSRETGVNVVKGTAYYTKQAHPDHIESSTQSEVEEEFVSDITDGIGDTNIRAGIVGEIGLSGSIHPSEEKVLRAAVNACLQTGAPLSIHPPGRTPASQKDRTYPTSRWSLEVLDIIEEEGLPAERVVMDHMDRTIYEDISYQEELADRGVYLEFDLWGVEDYLEKFNDSYPSDNWRVDAVTHLIDQGYESQLLFSHDIGKKTALQKYGGFGYAHIISNVVPMLAAQGVSRDTIDTILRDNPQTLLTFAPS